MQAEAESESSSGPAVAVDKQLLGVLQRLIAGQTEDLPEEYKHLRLLDRQSAFDKYVSVVDGLVAAFKALPKEVDAAVLRRQNESLLHVVDTLRNELVQLKDKVSKNVELENEVDRLCRELDEATGGVNKRGFLYKYRVRENLIGTKWVRRFFVLSGSTLSYYGSEQETRPWKTMSLDGCTVRYEGTKRNGQYHVFGIYLANPSHPDDDVSNRDLLMRLSSDSEADAMQWIDLLQQACEIAEADTSGSDEREGGIENAITRAEDDEAKPSKLPNLKSRSASHDEPAQEEKLGALSSASLQLRRMMALWSTTKGKKREVAHHKYKAESYPASRPMHRNCQPSLLSNESPRQNYRGFLNLGLIILVVTHFRLIIENVLKYGLLISSPLSLPADAQRPHHWTAILVMLNAFPLITLVTEKLVSRGVITDQQYLTGNFANITVALFLPLFYVYFSDMSAVTGCLFIMQAIIHVLKLVSYCHVNRDLRLAKQAGVEVPTLRKEPSADGVKRPTLARQRSLVQNTDTTLEYPQNVTAKNLYWFLLAPTLSYQLNYPRSPKIRWNYVLSYAGRIVLFFGLMLFVIEQYVTPIVRSTVEPINKMHFLAAFERLLKLALPSTYVWLLMFYTFFHLWLNLLAEITRFGDRVFYKDWWNARSIETYWRLWNLPVHHWMVQHMYFPALRFGISKQNAIMLVFLLSAVLHELLISVPLHSMKTYAFIGMLAQAPLVMITKQLDRMFDNPFIGNAFFWISFCMIGQPMGMVLYYYDFSQDAAAEAAAAAQFQAGNSTMDEL